MTRWKKGFCAVVYSWERYKGAGFYRQRVLQAISEISPYVIKPVRIDGIWHDFCYVPESLSAACAEAVYHAERGLVPETTLNAICFKRSK